MNETFSKANLAETLLYYLLNPHLIGSLMVAIDQLWPSIACLNLMVAFIYFII